MILRKTAFVFAIAALAGMSVAYAQQTAASPSPAASDHMSDHSMKGDHMMAGHSMKNDHMSDHSMKGDHMMEGHSMKNDHPAASASPAA